MRKLKIGFLIDSLEVSYYVRDLIEHVRSRDHFHDPIIIYGHVKKREEGRYKKIYLQIRKSGLIAVMNRFLSALLIRLIKIIELENTREIYPNYDKNYNIKNYLTKSAISVCGDWSKSGLYLNFKGNDIQLLNDANLDCIVRCGSGILKGKILDAPKFGVLSFHHGDNRRNRGGPSGFWEVLNSEASSGFIIQKLNEELDGGAVLVRGNIMTLGTWTLNNAALLEKSNVFFKRLLDHVAETDDLPEAEEPRIHDGPLLKIDGAKILLKYILKVLVPKIIGRISSGLLTRNEIRWSVAYAKHNNFSKSLWRYKEIENPKGRYLADPFIIEHNNRKIIFVEDFFYSENKGRISAIELKDDEEEFLGVVLNEDFHLSFPFVFKHKEKVYMVPESSGANDIRLYRCVKFPKEWVLEKILMKDVSAADTMIVKEDKLWYMLTNICSAKLGDHNSELHIFYSEEIHSDEWLPIKSGNPVIFDSASARNGGLFYSNGELYRVNQIQDKSHYGKAFGVNKVLNLNKTTYVEKRVSNVDATFKDELCSTHHFNANLEVAAIDFGRKQRIRKMRDC